MGETGTQTVGTADAIGSVVLAAHELKSPLALVRQLTLELEQGTYSQTERGRLLRQIRLASEASLRLTTDLTKSAALQASLFPTESISPRPLINDVARELQPLFEAHGRCLAVNRKQPIVAVVANRDLLRRVLCNFVDNALHYSDERDPVELYAELIRQRSLVRLGVRDRSGSLTSAAWQSFRREGSIMPTSPSRVTSSGLGLRIARQFADAMDGSIGAVRHRTGGASFYIELPVSRQLSML